MAARYWFITDKGGFAEVGYTLTQDVVDVLTGDLRLVHEMICAGYFPPRTPDTWWADPILDLVGKAGLERAWANLEDVPEITDYVAKYGASQS